MERPTRRMGLLGEGKGDDRTTRLALAYKAMSDEEFLTWDQECFHMHTLFIDHFRGGLYAVFARRWLAHFPRRQFLWLTEEDLDQRMLDKVADFAELEQPNALLKLKYSSQCKRAGYSAKDINSYSAQVAANVSAEVMATVAKLYEPFNQLLQGVLPKPMAAKLQSWDEVEYS
uniref:Sulfotransferase n=1 Tax=Pyramimonas obovata TaxID=1411642 RepID=A0A7S0QTU8_9CHLO